MRTKVPYGESFLEFEIPDSQYMDYKAPETTLEGEVLEPEDIVKNAMANPIGTSSLFEIAKGKKTAAIIISDYTRPTPSAFLLPFVIEELTKGGISQDNITIVTASGLHDPSPDEDLQRMLGQYYGVIRTINHNADDEEHLVYLGETSRKTPIYLNKYVVEADVKVSIGCIEPHHSAGWSGGSKNVLPGIAGRKTIYHHHALSHQPGVELGKVRGNPFREDLDETGVKLGVDFILNVILNEKKEIIAAFAGDLLKAHAAGVAKARSLLEVKINERPDIVIVTPGGTPRDSNFWQAEGKALTRIKHVVKPGGTVILVAKGQEGIGKKEFADILVSYSYEEIIRNFKEQPFTVVLNKAFRLAQVLERATLFIVSEGLKKEMFPKLPIKIFSNIEEALEQALAKEGEKAKVLVVPKAPQVIIGLEEKGENQI